MDVKYTPNVALKDARERAGLTQEYLDLKLEHESGRCVYLYEAGFSRAPLVVRNAFVEIIGGSELDYRQYWLNGAPRLMAKNPSRVNWKLRNAIYGAGLTPAEVCRLGDRHRGTLGQYLSGRVPVTEYVAEWVSRIVGCEPAKLIV